MTGETPAAVAAGAAAASALNARVDVREITGVPELKSAVELFSLIWGREENPPVTVELLRAFAKAGNYIGGAYDGDELLGASVAFTAVGHTALHSHIAGVSDAARGRSVGFALKLHQRAWALERGIPEIAWTFDPLVSRNAYFNLVKLAAEPAEYLPNFYGGLKDAINGDDESDRLLVRWKLDSPAVVDACNGVVTRGDAALERARGAVDVVRASSTGAPMLGRLDGDVSLVAVPIDIEALRVDEPDRARQWRGTVRSALMSLMAGGGRVSGYDRVGCYIVRRENSSAALTERNTP